MCTKKNYISMLVLWLALARQLGCQSPFQGPLHRYRFSPSLSSLWCLPLHPSSAPCLCQQNDSCSCCSEIQLAHVFFSPPIAFIPVPPSDFPSRPTQTHPYQLCPGLLWLGLYNVNPFCPRPVLGIACLSLLLTLAALNTSGISGCGQCPRFSEAMLCRKF